MSMPIARGGWWTGARDIEPSLPPPKPEHEAASPQPTSSTSSRPIEYFTASPTPVQGPVAPGSVRSLLPADAAHDSEPKAHPNAGLEKDDPRNEVIDQGYQVQDIDRQVNALADQQIDIEGAEARVKAAQAAQDALDPEQEQKLRRAQRETESALIDLQGQQLGQKLIQAQSKGNQEELSLVMADARVYISSVRQVEATRKLQDALAVVMTPENQKKLAAPEKKLRDAASKVQASPSDADAQEALKTAQKEFDTALTGVVSSSDKHALDVLEAAAQREQELGELLLQEADIEHRHHDMNQKSGDDLNATEKRVIELTNTQYELVKKQREIRELGVEAASSTDEGHTQELLEKLDGAIVEIMRKRAETNVDRAEFNLKFATENATSPVKVAKQFEAGLPPEKLTVAEANKQVDAAKDQLAKLQEALKPPPPEPKGFWDRALDIGVGALEVAVGAALTFGSGGLLAAAGVLIMADGAARTTHSIVDAVNGTDTDTYQSQAMQGLFGMDRGAANRVDVGISLLAMAPGMGVGALKLIASAGKFAKAAGAFGAVTTLDTVQAQLRYAALNQNATPFAVQGLTSIGMSHTAANYVMLSGAVVSTIGLGRAAARARPGPTELAFKEFTIAATSKDAPATTRVADWYGRNAPEDVRRSVAAELLGPDASPRAIARQAEKLANNSLVLIRDSADGGDMFGAAVLESNARGRFGLDPVGNKVGKRTTEVRDTFGDDVTIQQALAAAVIGAEKFTNQNAIAWNTNDPQDSRQAPGAIIAGQRVRRDALDTFNRMPEAERPDAVNAALASSTSPEAQLRALAEISTNDRYAWPAQTRDIVYKRVFNRPPSLFGNETLGKIVHVMDKQSYVNQFNAWANPAKRAIGVWEKSHPRVQEVETFPAAGGRPAMAATLNKSNSLDEASLYEIASASIESRRLLGADTEALSSIPAGQRVAQVMDDLRGKDVITIRDEHGNLIAGGAMSRHGAAAPRGTVHLSNLFTAEADGWRPLMSAAEKAAKEQGGRQLALDPAIPHLIELDPQASSFMQGAYWNTRDYLSHARASVELKAGALKDSLTSIDDPRLNAIIGAGRTAGGRVSSAGHWLSEHLNPYSYPDGLAPTALRAAIQDAGHALRYYAKQGIHMGRNGVLLSLGPQAAAGQMYFVTNDNRTVLPFNGLPDSPSLALYFGWTGTMITLWGNGPNARGPAPLDPNGLQPLMRIRPALNDPNGPNSAGILATGRLILAGEVNLGVRWFGSNDGVSAQSTMSMRFGRVNSNVRADVPVQPGGPKGFSLIGSLTALAPSMSHAIYIGPFGGTVRTPRVTMIGTMQTAPLSAADQNAAFRAGEHHTRGAKGVSGGTGFYFTLNPAYGVPDFTPP